MRNHRIASIPADGIGPEVIAAGLEALEAVALRDGGFRLDVQHLDWGSARYRRTGALMPDDGLDQLRGQDAILFGAVGAPDIPDHVTLWGLRLPICQGFDQYANIRPTRLLPGVTGPLRGRGTRRAGLADRARELRGRVFRQWRAHPSRPARGSRDRNQRLHPPRRRAHHAFRLRRGPPPPAQAADRGHQKQRPAPRHGLLGRDRCPGGPGLPGRDLGQGTGGRHDHPHGPQAPEHRHRGGHQPACGHPVGPGGRPGRLARHRAHRQRRPRTPLPQHVRTHPRQRLRHHRQGHRQPGRHLLAQPA